MAGVLDGRDKDISPYYILGAVQRAKGERRQGLDAIDRDESLQAPGRPDSCGLDFIVGADFARSSQDGCYMMGATLRGKQDRSRLGSLS